MGYLLGFGALGVLVFFAWIILQIVGRWKMFQKAGKPGWHSIIPILNSYDEYDICWIGWIGIVAAICIGYASGNANAEDPSTLVTVCGAAGTILNAVLSYKLSKSFGHGVPFAVGLFFLGPIFRIILGFGDSKYIGK